MEKSILWQLPKLCRQSKVISFPTVPFLSMWILCEYLIYSIVRQHLPLTQIRTAHEPIANTAELRRSIYLAWTTQEEFSELEFTFQHRVMHKLHYPRHCTRRHCIPETFG
ncbi:hypothetical protein KIL84_018371 [Mauremys mutica]|uniref:Uncharacterized protein n=1 Tax=Mauremys mutica TaxID=74926 RepID=A0A9D4B2C9_9SAUR|nr:hypothetical protein KIL84_018371 [Mauremys mutica]